MERLYNVSLSQPKFEITPFEAVTYDPKEGPDVSLLINTFDKIENRQNNAVKAKADVLNTFSTLDPKLNKDDEETMNWWNDYQQNIMYDIEHFVRIGDYSKAYQYATEKAAEVANNKELLARQHSYETFKIEKEKLKNRVSSGDIRQATYNMVMKENPFTNDFIRDEYGNVISSKDFQLKKEPVKDFDVIKHIASAFQLLNPDSTAVGRSTRRDVATSKHRKGSAHSTDTKREILTPERVLDMIQDTFDMNGDNIEALGQRYETDLDMLKDWEAEYDALSDEDKNGEKGKTLQWKKDKLKELIYRNGVPCGAEWYYARLIAGGVNAGLVDKESWDDTYIGSIAEGLSYSRTSNSRSNESSVANYDDDDSSGGNSGRHHRKGNVSKGPRGYGSRGGSGRQATAASAPSSESASRFNIHKSWTPSAPVRKRRK